MDEHKNSITFNELEWDTTFFGVASAKAILHRPLLMNEWSELLNKFKEYEFISIMNSNSEPVNSQLIGKDTTAFLIDVNIQFVKILDRGNSIPRNVTIHQSLEKNTRIIEIAEFQFSRFSDDPRLAERGGNEIYRQWLVNAFNKPEKKFAISKDDDGNINGFLLYSFFDDSCILELIAVDKNIKKKGIGTSLFQALECDAYRNGILKIKVGTQIRNTLAINFYQKLGCKQVGCHQVYHYWVEY